MIFLIAVLGGILTGLLFKGKLKNLMALTMKQPWLLLVFFFLDLFFNSRYSQVLTHNARFLVVLLLSIQYGSLFALVIINRKRWPLLIIGLGELANYLAIMANGGRMPVDTALLPGSPTLSSLLEGYVPHYGALDATTRLPFLGDILYLPIPSPVLLSAGDLVVWLGLFLLMLHAMMEKSKMDKSKQPINKPKKEPHPYG